MPRGLNGTHRELSLTGAVASDIWRPPALQAREDPNTNGEYGTVHPAREAREQVQWTCERRRTPRAQASGSARAQTNAP